MFSTTYKFKSQNVFKKRLEESERICKKYEDRIPIIVEVAEGSNITLDKTKYLVPRDLTVSQFMYVIRKRVNLSDDNALFIFYDGTLKTQTDLLSAVYKAHRDADGFLYATVSQESTFG